jgi:hypothetical protein
VRSEQSFQKRSNPIISPFQCQAVWRNYDELNVDAARSSELQ